MTGKVNGTRVGEEEEDEEENDDFQCGKHRTTSVNMSFYILIFLPVRVSSHGNRAVVVIITITTISKRKVQSVVFVAVAVVVGGNIGVIGEN